MSDIAHPLFRFVRFAPIALAVAPITLFVVAVTADTGREVLVPGPTSSGHHQIESRCESCHSPFGGVSDEACLRCHDSALQAQNDTHAPAKFEDPGLAGMLVHVDARSCLSCHREHRAEARQRGSVSVAGDFCLPCHTEVLQSRPSHQSLPATSCADVGCHNYHDNRHLHRDLLVKERDRPADLPKPWVPLPSPGASSGGVRAGRALVAGDADLQVPAQRPGSATQTAAVVVADWAASGHARVGVNCSGCHDQGRVAAGNWKVERQLCGDCHGTEQAGFLAGKHGMRLPEGLAAIRPAQARAAMKGGARDRQLDCSSCHGSHRFDTTLAAVEACEGCHDDGHTRAYRNSPHFTLWQAERRGSTPPGSGVSCATCHLPRREHREAAGLAMRVVHNQNDNLRPPDRMARDVCGHCHGLGFSLAALADPALVGGNFRGAPGPVRTAMDFIKKEQP